MAMKTRNLIYIAAILSCTFACKDPLELDPTGWHSETVVYDSPEHMDLYVKSLYAVLYANADISAGYIFDDCVTDLVKESWYGTGGGTVNKFFYQSDIITPESNFRSNWGMYSYIRQINEFFFDYNYGYIKAIDPEIVKVRLAEARFLRAFAYQELVLRHGGVILRVREDHVDGPEDKAMARTPEQQCWNFIISEYEKAAADLPLSWSGTDYGRITKGAAIGMKARANLYAKRWQKAVDACDELFKLNQYQLLAGSTYDDYYKIFTSFQNKELILPVLFAQSTGGATGKQHNFNSYFCPPGDGQPYNVSVGAAATPTEEYASRFDIKVGGTWQAFDWDNLASYGGKPFDNRDPRFYASILYNGAQWKGRTLEIYEEGLDGFMTYKSEGQDNQHKSTTGYLFRKFVSDDASMNYTSILSGQYWVEMRLAEIYLIRSEANARLEQWKKAYDDLNAIRGRAGLDEAPQKNNWDDYQKDLDKERVCELGLEGHRFFDLVRWGKAQEVLDGKRLHGVKATPVTGGFSYEVVECDTQDRHFPAKYNIWPIPYSELTTNKLCEQNAVWGGTWTD